jgi:polyphosphate kinase 2 (PPK2 family)
MLEALDLTQKLSAKESKEQISTLRRRLHALQRACYDAEIGTIVLFEGWDTAGKSTTIRKLVQRLEPRAFSTYSTREPRTHEKLLPWMWRFWVNVPNWGEMAIFDRSWYGRVLVERVDGLATEREWKRAYGDITSFEQALADDRYDITKFFLHITREEQADRLTALEASEATRWKVTPEDWVANQRYDEHLAAVEEMLERTDTEWAPWTLVEATDHRHCRVKVLKTLVRRMERSLSRRGLPLPGSDLDLVPAEKPAEER